MDAASSEIFVLRQRIAFLEATLAEHGIAVPDASEGAAAGSGAMMRSMSVPGVDRPADRYPRGASGGAAAGGGPMAAWVDTEEIPLPIRGSTAPPDLGQAPGAAQLTDDVDADSAGLSPPRTGTGGEEDEDEDEDDDLVEEELLDQVADGDGPPTPEQLEKVGKFRKQLMSLETKLQMLESERRQAESMLHSAKKERDAEAQQHALRVAVLEKEIAMVTQEMVRITTDATRNQLTKDEKTIKVKVQLEEKLARMKAELTELRSAYRDTQKKLTVQRSSTERIANLQTAIEDIKEEKSKLLRRMKEEKVQSREKSEQERRNSAHLQKSLNRKSWEVTKLKAEKERQGLILERKKEEVQLNKQKIIELQQKSRSKDFRESAWAHQLLPGLLSWPFSTKSRGISQARGPLLRSRPTSSRPFGTASVSRVGAPAPHSASSTGSGRRSSSSSASGS